MIKQCIYKFYFEDNPNRIYVGSAVIFNKRKYKHKWDLKNNCHHNKYIQNVYNKYNYTPKDLNFEMLEEIKDIKNLKKQETYWCRHLKENGYELFNFNDPEVPPMLGKNHTKETLQKMRENNARYWEGKLRSEESRQKMSIAHLGKINSKETRQKLSKINSGKGNPMYGKYHTKESNLKNALSRGASPFQVFKDNNLTGEWINQHQCARDLNLIRSNINACLHKRRKTHKGYTFKFK